MRGSWLPGPAKITHKKDGHLTQLLDLLLLLLSGTVVAER